MHRTARPVLTACTTALALLLGCGGEDASSDPTSALVVTPGSLTLTEGNAPTQLFVTMDRAPDAPLTIDIGTLGNVTLSKSTLTFTPGDFTVPQVVAVTPPEDVDLEAEVDTLTFTSGGNDFRRVPVLVADNDAQEIQAGAVGPLLEGGNIAVGINLKYQPSEPVTVTVATNGKVTRVPATLIFTSANFATPQNVTLTSIEDNDAIPDIDTLRLASPGVATTSVPVAVVENDIQEILVTPDTLALNEGFNDVVNVSLKFKPAGNVTVTLTSNGDTHVHPTTSQVIFTPANFATPQPATILARQDADAFDDEVLVTLQAPGVFTTELIVFVTDND